ncbi:MAG TPA: thiamine pyrophosphate-dependent enzyme [Nitriliruptoraceae bacterium]|nr:thiamine pyrophosphate-dependent enzyme [Nitriliruptoraceae bacterium]
MPSPSSGSAVLAQLLVDHGVDVTIGVLDASFADLAVALDDHDVRRIAPSTESATVHMAAAWSHTTGRAGVALVASGFGLAHALPAMADAQQTGDRVLVISTSRRAGVTGPNRAGLVAGLDNAAATDGVVKWSGRVPSGERLVEMVGMAMRALWVGAPGVVHLDIPSSVLSGPAPHLPPTRDEDRPDPNWWRTAARPGSAAMTAGLLVRAHLPVLHLGRGVAHSGAEEQVRRLVAELDAGVTTTWGGRGVVAEDDLHVIPPTQPGVVDDLRKDADVVMVLGADLGESDWWGQPPHWGPRGEQTIIHVDLDGAAIGRHRAVDLGIVGDLATVLDEVLDEVAALGARDTVARRHMLGDHRSAVRRGRANLNEPLVEADRTPIHPAAAVVATRLAMPDDTAWVFDGGHTRRWGQFHIPALHPRTQFGVGPLELTGSGVGHAMGVRLAAPDRAVCAIMGDGAFARQLGELPTSIELDLPFVAVVLVDGYAGPVDATAGSDRGGAGAGGPGTARSNGARASSSQRGEDDGSPSRAGAGDGGTIGPDDRQGVADPGDGTGGGEDGAGGRRKRGRRGGRRARASVGASRDSRTAGASGDGSRTDAPPDAETEANGEAESTMSDTDAGAVRAASRPSVEIRSIRDLSTGVQTDPVRYDLVARSLGAWGEFVDHPSQLAPALERARDAGRLAVVHVSVDRVEHTWTPEAGMFRSQRAPERRGEI